MDLLDANNYDEENNWNGDVNLNSLRRKRRKNKNLDYILGIVDEEIALLRDEIDKQGREIENVKERLNRFDKTIKK